VVGIVPKLLKMLHKRLGLLSFPNGKRAVPPTENGERKKHTSRRRHNMEKAQTCSKPWATEMLGCSCRGSEEWEWESEQGTSISQIGGGGVFAFFKEYFLSSLVSRPRAKGPKTREGQELFEGDSVLEMTVAQKQIVVVNFGLGLQFI